MLIQNYWGGHEGGAERQCRKQSHALAALGHEVTILTRWPGFPVPLRQTDGATGIVRVGWFEPCWRIVQWLKQRLLSASAQERRSEVQALHGGAHMAPVGGKRGILYPVAVLRQGQFILSVWWWVFRHRKKIDIFHVHESHWIAGVGGWLSRLFGIPVVSKVATFPALPSNHGAEPFKKKWDQERRNIHFIALNNALKDELVAEGIPVRQISVVPNGVVIPDEVVIPENNKNCLFIGNFSQGKRKGFDVLFSAWEKIYADFPDSKLILLGGGDAGYWQEIVRKNHMEEAVDFVGFTAEVDRHVSEAAFLALPSRFEGMSNALLESMSYGLPAVVSDIPANIELVTDGVNGRVVPVEDIDRMAAVMRELLGDDVQRKRLGAEARETIQSQYAIEAVAKKISLVYEFLKSKAVL